MSYQYPNLAQSNGSPPPPPEDATLTAIHNAFLLGWSLMELKSRVQIAACNVALDSILIIQPQSADPPGTQSPQTTLVTDKQQPDVIDALVENIVLKGVPHSTANGSEAISAKAQSLSTEMRDNLWLTSVMRELFRRIAILHLQRFPTSDTSNTMYDINPPTQANPAPSAFPYLYLYPGKFDYANVGISMMKPDDTVSQFVQNFRLYDVTRRTLNCLTLLWTTPNEALAPETIECYQKRLVVLATWIIRSKKKSFGLPSSASFSLSGELSHRSRRGIVLVYKRKHGDMGSRPSRKACSGCMRELQKASSDTTLLAGWSSSTRLPLAHVVLLQATQR